ncbi:hypothetical protein ACFL1H_05080, partial [Nanoarchaeota archaeon]
VTFAVACHVCTIDQRIVLYGNSNNTIINSTITKNSYPYNNFYGNSINKIENTDFVGRAYFEDDSVNTINDSTFQTHTYFQDNSNSTIENSSIFQFWMYDTPLIEFINSEISNILIVSGHPTIKGTVNISTKTVQTWQATANVTRYYPIYVYDFWGQPVNNSQVNITEGSDVFWTGYTDENGYAEPDLTFEQTEQNNIFNLTTEWNPTVQDDISFTKNTSITLQHINNAPDLTDPSLTPSTAYINSTFNCSTVVTDQDQGDTLTVEFKWYKNGSTLFSNNVTSLTNGSLAYDILGPNNFTHFENITCSARVTDSYNITNWKNSSTVTILNSAPTVTVTEPNGAGDDNRSTDFTVTWTANDIDSDTLNISCFADNDNSNNDINYTGFNLEIDDGTQDINVTTWTQDTYYIWCYASDLYSNSSFTYSSGELQVNHEPQNYQSDDNGAGLTNDNESIEFDGQWSDPNDYVGFYVSYTSNDPNCKYGSTSNCLCYEESQTDGTGNCTLSSLTSLSGSYTWYSWACDDQQRCSIQVTDSFEINNQPIIGQPTIPGTFYTDDTMTCINGSYADTNGDSETTSNREFNWYDNNVLVAGQSASTLDLTTPGLDKLNNITCQWRTTDEHGYLSNWSANSTLNTILNSAPTTPSSSFLNAADKVNEILVATGNGSTDADTDSIIYYYEFRCSNSTGNVLQAKSTTDNWTITTACKHDTVYILIWANDGTVDSPTNQTISRTIINTIPLQNKPTINSSYGLNKTYEDVYCYSDNVTDNDNDAVTITYNWYKNNNIISGVTSNILLKGNYTGRDNITCVSNADDSYDIGKENSTIFIIPILFGDSLSYSGELTEDIIGSGIGLTINNNNINLNCNGYQIIGDQTDIGIKISLLNNITIKNCNIQNTTTGIEIRSDNSLIQNNTITRNSYVGLDIERSNYCSFINNRIYENGFHGLFVGRLSINNTFINTTIYNNSLIESDGYELYLGGAGGDSAAGGNIFNNTLLINSIRYLTFDLNGATPKNNTFNNFIIAYNESIGLIDWEHLFITTTPTLTSSIIKVDPEFVSVIVNSIQEFNNSADITILTENCSNGLLVKPGFPTSRNEILLANTNASTAIKLSCSNNITKWQIQDWSGYTSGTSDNAPTWSNNLTNIQTTTKYNDTVWFSVNWSDDNGIQSSIFSWNGSNCGVMENITFNCQNSTSCKQNETLQIGCTRDKVLCWNFYGYDTYGTLVKSDSWCSTIANSVPTITINEPNGANDDNRTTDFTVTWTANDNDNDPLNISCYADNDNSNYDVNYTGFNLEIDDSTQDINVTTWEQDTYYIWCYATDIYSNSSNIYSSGELQVNHAPYTYQSDDNGAGLTNDNESIEFDGQWSDPNDYVGFYVSYTSNDPNCKYGSTSNCVCYEESQTDGTGNCTLSSLTSLSGSYTWYSWACDDQQRCSTQVTDSFEINNAPTIGQPSIPGTFYTDDIMTCVNGSYADTNGDSETPANREFKWYDNNVLVAGQSASTLDLTTSGLNKLDNITCQWLTTDEHSYLSDWSANSSTNTILNSAPTTPPSSFFNSADQVGEILVAAGNGSIDADTDSITYYYEFRCTSPTGTLLQAKSTQDNWTITTTCKHDTVYTLIWANDGTVDSPLNETISRAIINTAPTTPTGSSLNTADQVGEILVATGAGSTDADTDSITYYYEFRCTSPTGTLLQSKSTKDNWTITNTCAHDTVYTLIWANDTYTESTLNETLSRAIINTAPTTPSGSSLNAADQVGETLVATGTGSTDVDNDVVTYYYEFRCTSPTGTLLQAKSTQDNWTITNTCAHDTVYTLIWANDTYTESALNETLSRTIINTAPTTPSGSSLNAADQVGELLVATGTGSTDVDNDGITYYYEFRCTSPTGTLLQAKSTKDNWTITNTCAHDTVYTLIWANDGTIDSPLNETLSRSIINTKPYVYVTEPNGISDENRSTDFTVTWNANDIDNDILNISCFADNDNSNFDINYTGFMSETNDGTQDINVTLWVQDTYYIWCYSYDGYENSTFNYSSSELQVNHAPDNYQSDDNGAGLTNDNLSILFDGQWSDPNDYVGFYVSYTSNDPNCKYGSTSNCICYEESQTDGTGNCTLSSLTSMAGSYTWYSWACDDQQRCSLQVTDSFEINNPPTIGQPSITGTYYTNDIMTCINGSYADTNSDSENTGNRLFRWYDNNVLVAGQTSNTLDLTVSGLDRTDNITCQWITTDEHGYNSDWSSNSSINAIQNNLPENTVPTILPSSPVSIDTLNCSTYFYDTIDNETFTVDFKWYKNNVINYSSSYSNQNNGTLLYDYLLPSNFSYNDDLFCSARVTDSLAYSAWKNSSTVTIDSYCGNGLIEGTEQCDNATDNGKVCNVSEPGNQCTSTCTIVVCPTVCYNCTDCDIKADQDNLQITFPGNLTSDIATCINISGDNVTLDCMGNYLIGDGTGIGVVIEHDYNKILNCGIDNFSQGMVVNNSNGNEFRNNIFVNNGLGILLYGNYNHTFINNENQGNTAGIEIEMPGIGNIRWTNVTFNSSFIDLYQGLNVSDNFLDVNISQLHESFNGTATITFYDVPYTTNPIILYWPGGTFFIGGVGIECPSTICSNVQRIGDDVSFDVAHFTSFSSEGTVTPPSTGGGRGGAQIDLACDPEWQCDEWSECIDGTQSRTCEDMNGCSLTNYRISYDADLDVFITEKDALTMIETKDCVIDEIEENISVEENITIEDNVTKEENVSIEKPPHVEIPGEIKENLFDKIIKKSKEYFNIAATFIMSNFIFAILIISVIVLLIIMDIFYVHERRRELLEGPIKPRKPKKKVDVGKTKKLIKKHKPFLFSRFKPISKVEKVKKDKKKTKAEKIGRVTKIKNGLHDVAFNFVVKNLKK